MKSRRRRVQKLPASPRVAKTKSIASLGQEITEPKRADLELHRMRRALLTMSQCNHAVMCAQSEQELIESVCRNLVDAGGYRMAWVGYAEQDEAKQVRPVAHAGFEEGYLSLAQITWGEDVRGRGPTGRAIRTGQPVINRGTQIDAALSPWREEALKRGYLSSLALPLRLGAQTFGTLTLYASEPDAFDDDEMKLLSELAEDLSFGIDTIRTRVERQRADEARQASELRFRTLMEEAPLAIRISRNGRTLFINRSYRQMYGIGNPDEIIGQSALEQWAPESRAMVAEFVRRRALGLPVPTQYEGVGQRQDGSQFPVQITIASVNLPDGPANMAFLTDLTERQRAQQALLESEAAFRTLAEAVPQLVWMCTPDGLNIYFNQRWVDYTGLTLEESYGKGWNTPFHPDDKQAAWDAWNQATETGEKYQVESRLRAAKGSYRWFLMRGEPLRDASGRIGKWFGTCTDIDELKYAAEALEREKAFTEAVIDSFPDIFLVIQQDRKFLHWGRNPERILGYSSEETLAMENAVAIVAEEDRALAAEKMQEAFAQGSISLEVRLLHRDGRTIPYFLRATRAAIGQEIYLVGFGLDITERKQAEEALRQSEAALKEALLAAQMGVWNLTIETGTVAWDENLYRLAGRDPRLPAPKYQELSQIYTPASWERLKPAVEHALATGSPYELDLEMLRPDGTKRWWISRGAAVRDVSGCITSLRGTVQDITERKRAEAQSKESEEKFRKAFMTGADAFYIATLTEGRLIEANDRFYELFGYSQEETLGKTPLELGLYAHPGDRERMVSEVKSKGLVRSLELKGKTKDGTLITVLLSVNLLEGGNEQLVLGVVRDITEQKQAEEALRETATRLKDAEQLAHLGSSTWDVATDATMWSDELYRIVGRDPRLPPPKHQERAAIYTPESWERLESAVNRALAAGEPYDLDLEVVRPDGTRRQVHAQGAAVRGDSAGVLRLHGTLQDITDRKAAEQAVLEAEGEYRKIYEGALEGIYRTSLEGESLRANPAMAQMLGYESAEAFISATNDMAQQVWLDPGERSRYVGLAQEYGTLRGFECQFKRKDGTAIWVSLNSRLVRGADGHPLYFEGFIEDISARKKAEAEHVRLVAAIEQSAEAVMITNPAGDIEYVNPAFTWITGYSREEILGKSPRILKSDKQDSLFYKELWAIIQEGRTWKGELINRRKDGSLYTEQMAITPVRDACGEITHYIATKQDVTERKALEVQLHQASKMEAIGRLAGGVAHDFNNLLTIMNGYSELLLETHGPGDPATAYLTHIKTAGDRAASLTRQLLAFSRRQVLAPEVLNLNVVISNIGRMLTRLIGEDVKLHTVLDPALGRVKADPGQIEQVIMNLAVNARDAMPSGGNLTIETSNVELDDDYAHMHATVKPGPHVMLAVADTGTGMTTETKARIFEPFFTTKEQGKGTGLGLATVYGIVKQSGGSIWVYSELDHGTVFKIYLPAAGEGLAQEHHAKPETGSPFGTETVLVVEDEDGVRAMIRHALESRGYQVLETDDAEKAVTMCASYEGTIHLLLTDVVMPKMSGPAVAEKVSALRPGVKVLYMSGYTDDAIVHHGVLSEGMPFIQKPFSPITLRKKIREVLGEK